MFPLTVDTVYYFSERILSLKVMRISQFQYQIYFILRDRQLMLYVTVLYAQLNYVLVSQIGKKNLQFKDNFAVCSCRRVKHFFMSLFVFPE